MSRPPAHLSSSLIRSASDVVVPGLAPPSIAASINGERMTVDTMFSIDRVKERVLLRWPVNTIGSASALPAATRIAVRREQPRECVGLGCGFFRADTARWCGWST